MPLSLTTTARNAQRCSSAAAAPATCDAVLQRAGRYCHLNKTYFLSVRRRRVPPGCVRALAFLLRWPRGHGAPAPTTAPRAVRATGMPPSPATRPHAEAHPRSRLPALATTRASRRNGVPVRVGANTIRRRASRTACAPWLHTVEHAADIQPTCSTDPLTPPTRTRRPTKYASPKPATLVIQSPVLAVV